MLQALRPGGRVLFRDYAEDDLAQKRLAGAGRQKRIEENCYVRGDGTLAYYFSKGARVGDMAEVMLAAAVGAGACGSRQ